MKQGKSFVVYTYTHEDKSAKRRRKIKFWTFLLFTIIFLSLIGSFALWKISPGPNCAALVIDKTVPHPDYREHKALFWVLNHTKVAKKEGRRLWRLGIDYVGFYPEKFIASDASFSSELKQSHLEGIDCLFLVDTYGVYMDDYKYPEKYHTHLDYSQKIYGGLQPEEVDAIVREVLEIEAE